MALKSIIKPAIAEDAPAEAAAPLGGTRAEAVQRLQVGAFGLGAILLLIGVANVFLQRAELVEESAVPEAAPTVAAEEEVPQQSDPLADAGVVPELPAEPEEEAEADSEDDPITGAAGEVENSEGTAETSAGNGGAAQP